MSDYAWVIDKVLWTNDERCKSGPRHVHESWIDLLHSHKDRGLPFRLLDDDRKLMYEGRILPVSISSKYATESADQAADRAFADREWSEVEWFAPLDDYGEPNAGCTIIQYQNSNGEWEDL